MTHARNFSSLFAISQKERAAAFTTATHLTSRLGIKVLYTPIPSEQPPRFFIACTRTVKGSVIRNKIRRQLKALLYEQQHLTTKQSGMYLIVLYEQATHMDAATRLRFVQKMLKA
jgi:ribonuclease P protein component